MIKILERARDIVVKPRETWQVVKEEETDIKQIFINYAAPLALIPMVCGLIGMTLIGIRLPSGEMVRAPFVPLLIANTVAYVVSLVGILIGGWIIKVLAPIFKAKADLTSAIKVVAYSMTPFWLVGIFSLVPGLAILSLLGLYSIYLLVLGLSEVLNTPSKKLAFYTLAVLFLGLIVSVVLNGFITGMFYGPIYLQMMAA